MRAFRDYLRTPPSLTKPKTGLFGIKGLNSAKDLTRFAQNSLNKAQRLSQELHAPRTAAGSHEIRKLDALSDTLCRAVDLAAFVRISHPDPQMIDSAQQVHELLFGFMSELNTSRELFNLVNMALANPEVQCEERKVGEILRHDFLKSGLQFQSDPRQQQKFVQLSHSISVKGQQFLYGCAESNFLQTSESGNSYPYPPLVCSVGELAGVSPALLARLAQMSGATSLMANKIVIPPGELGIAEHILSTASNPETRKRVWKFSRAAPAHQVQLLDEVLTERKELAMLAGLENYAEYELGDKLMQHPNNVSRFLSSLATKMYPLAQQELAKIGGPGNPWDYSYILTKYRSQLRRMASPPQFELASVFETIGDLTDRLYGLKFVPGDVAPGETWHPEVKRIDVFDENDNSNRVGVIYCDLMNRPGKQPNPAHFTVQCARKLYDEDKFDGENSNGRQLPIIALVCDFEPHSRSGNVMLQYHEVKTLFHEMGHAIHSMIGRTDLHNIAGTRCSTDFVELPSILFEKFASRPEVLSMMKPDLDAQSFLTKQNKMDAASQHCEVWHQLNLSFLDQALHGSPFDRMGSSQLVADEVTAKFSLYPQSLPMENQFSQQFAHFGHLISYGATYYSYLFDRCLAEMAWETCFEQFNSWDQGGRKFKEHVLKWGGARNGHACMEDLLNRELDHSEVASYLVKENI